MPRNINYEVDLQEILHLIDKLLLKDLHNKQTNLNWQQKVLSEVLLQLSLAEYAQLPSALQNKCLLGKNAVYISADDYARKELIEEDLEDWQLAYTEGLRVLQDILQDSYTKKIHSFKLKSKVAAGERVTKYSYYVLLNADVDIHDIIRILPRDRLDFQANGNARLGLSWLTGEIYELKTRTPKYLTFSEQELNYIENERNILCFRRKLLGFIDRVGFSSSFYATDKIFVQKATNCMSYSHGDTFFADIANDKVSKCSSLQDKIMLLQAAIEIGRLHNDNIIHLNIKPENFQVDKVDDKAGMVLVNLINFDVSAKTNSLRMPLAFTPLYAPPEIAHYFIFGEHTEQHIDPKITSHDIRSLGNTDSRPSGMFIASEQPVGTAADVYSFGNMLWHDYNLQLPFVNWMLHDEATLRPSIGDVVYLLTNNFIHDGLLSHEERFLLVTLAMQHNYKHYKSLINSIFVSDRVFNGLSLEQQSSLLLYKSRIAKKLCVRGAWKMNIYIAFLLLKHKQLTDKLILAQEQIPTHGCLYLLFHPQEKARIKQMTQFYLGIEQKLLYAAQILRIILPSRNIQYILHGFQRECAILQEKYTVAVPSVLPSYLELYLSQQARTSICIQSARSCHIDHQVQSSIAETSQLSQIELTEFTYNQTERKQSVFSFTTRTGEGDLQLKSKETLTSTPLSSFSPLSSLTSFLQLQPINVRFFKEIEETEQATTYERQQPVAENLEFSGEVDKTTADCSVLATREIFCPNFTGISRLDCDFLVCEPPTVRYEEREDLAYVFQAEEVQENQYVDPPTLAECVGPRVIPACRSFSTALAQDYVLRSDSCSVLSSPRLTPI